MDKIEKFENSPIRESMNSQSRGKGWDMKQYYNGSNNRRIIGRYLRKYLKKSVGKNYNAVRKHVLEKFKDVHARHESNVADSILSVYVGNDKSYYDYIVDEQGILQVNQAKIDRDNYWANYKRSRKRTVSSDEPKTYKLKDNLSTEDMMKLRYILISKIRLTRKQIEHIMNNGIIQELLYNILIDRENRYFWFRKLTTEESAFVANCFDLISGVDYVIKDNNEYRKYKKESLDQARKKYREKVKFESEMRNEELSDALTQDKRKRRIQKSKVKWPDVYLDE